MGRCTAAWSDAKFDLEVESSMEYVREKSETHRRDLWMHACFLPDSILVRSNQKKNRRTF